MALIDIVEDDDDIREIEIITMKNSGYNVQDFICWEDFSKSLEEKIPDLILLDLMLPDKDGYEIIKRLRSNQKYRRIPVIIVTAKATELDMIKGLDVGADDYLKKPFSVIELVTRTKALLRRMSRTNQTKQLVLGNIILDQERHSVSVDNNLCDLTYKEYELLKLFLENIGVVLSRDVIMQRIWGTNYQGESRTVDMHIKTLREKIKYADNKIKTVRNVGYVIE